MPEWVRVVPEDLHVSATRVGMHADDVESLHTAADRRIDAAQAGVPSRAGVALSAAVAKWRVDTTVLFNGLVDHGQALAAAAAAYLDTEDGNAANLESLGGAAAPAERRL